MKRFHATLTVLVLSVALLPAGTADHGSHCSVSLAIYDAPWLSGPATVRIQQGVHEEVQTVAEVDYTGQKDFFLTLGEEFQPATSTRIEVEVNGHLGEKTETLTASCPGTKAFGPVDTLNRLPDVTVRFDSESFSTADDLLTVVLLSDPDGDDLSAPTFSWKKNGAILFQYDEDHIPASMMAQGDTFSVQVTTQDEYGGDGLAEATIKVGDEDDVPRAALHIPEGDERATGVFKVPVGPVTLDASDSEDGPNAPTPSADLLFAFDETSGLSDSELTFGSDATHVFTPDGDGAARVVVQDADEFVGHASVQVFVNQVPQVSSVALPATVRSSDTISVEVQAADADNDLADALLHDTLTGTAHWWTAPGDGSGGCGARTYPETAVPLSGSPFTAAAPFAAPARGGCVGVDVTVLDGLDEATGEAHVVVQNALPVAALDVQSGGALDPVVADLTVTDADDAADDVTCTVEWFLDTTADPEETDTAVGCGDQSLGAQLVKDQSWTVRVTPDDGIDAGAPVETTFVVAATTPTPADVVVVGVDSGGDAIDGAVRTDDDLRLTVGTVTAPDAPVDCTVTWTVDGADEGSGTIPDCQSGSTFLLDAAETRRGAYAFRVQAGDGGESTAAIDVANTPPVVNVHVDSYAPPRANVDWSDADDDAVACTFRWYLGDATEPARTDADVAGCSATQLAQADVGQAWTVEVTAVDAAGGETSDSEHFQVTPDPPPVVTVTPSRSPGSSGWYTSAVTFSASATDDGSGVDGCDENVVFNGPDGEDRTVTMQCRDLSGNVGSATYTFDYDAGAPTVSIPVSAWTKGGTVPIQVSDEGIGVDSWTAQYRVNDGPWQALDGSGFPTTTEGAEVDFRVQAEDKLGHERAYPTEPDATTTLDTTPPAAPTGLIVVPRAGGSFELAWSAPAADGAPVKSYVLQHRVGSGSFTNLATPTTTGHEAKLDADHRSTHEFKVAAVDEAGNVGAFSGTVDATAHNRVPGGTLLVASPSHGDGPASGEEVVFSWSGLAAGPGEEIVYRYELNRDDDEELDEDSASTTSTQVRFERIAPGTWYFHLLAVGVVGEVETEPTRVEVVRLLDDDAVEAANKEVQVTLEERDDGVAVSWTLPDDPPGPVAGVQVWGVDADGGLTLLATLEEDDEEFGNGTYLAGPADGYVVTLFYEHGEGRYTLQAPPPDEAYAQWDLEQESLTEAAGSGPGLPLAALYVGGAVVLLAGLATGAFLLVRASRRPTTTWV